MIFWIVSIGIAVVVAALLALALMRRGVAEGSAAFDVQVYRDQLKEVERDLARGVVTEAEADQVRIEVSRRLLDADKAAQADAPEGGDAPRAVTFATTALCAAVVVGGTAALYARVGAPEYPDMPLAQRFELAELARQNRPSQAQAETEAARTAPPQPELDESYATLMDQLRTALAERPNDLQGHQLLARNEAAVGRFAEAHRAQARVVTLKGEAATAEDFADLADLMVLAAGGFVSPEAEAVLRETLERDPANGTARYYSGLLAAQTGRPDIAFRVWRALLDSSPADAPWVPPIRAQIVSLSEIAGVDYVLPPLGDAPSGPTEDDIAAAEGMSPAARMQMIAGMVDGLGERLATEGGPPEDWARLIRALGVLGRRDQAAAVWQEAQQVFPDDITRVQILRAARDAGVER
ncbi:MAG: c-type cytochrome biogenesis protein CcmI [Pseudomonadota bacterium]